MESIPAEITCIILNFASSNYLTYVRMQLVCSEWRACAKLIRMSDDELYAGTIESVSMQLASLARDLAACKYMFAFDISHMCRTGVVLNIYCDIGNWHRVSYEYGSDGEGVVCVSEVVDVRHPKEIKIQLREVSPEKFRRIGCEEEVMKVCDIIRKYECHYESIYPQFEHLGKFVGKLPGMMGSDFRERIEIGRDVWVVDFWAISCTVHRAGFYCRKLD